MGIRPQFRLSIDRPAREGGFRQVYPFRRSWVVITILLAMDIAFLLPAWFTFQQAADAWSNLDGLFNLVMALFLSAWLLGWCIAPLLMSLLLLLLLFGREVAHAWRGPEGGVVELFLGLPLIGLSSRYQASSIRNFRWQNPAPKSGTAWRGPHITFDYGANGGEFGSAIAESDVAEIKAAMEAACSTVFRNGEATAGELSGYWESDAETARETAALEADIRDVQRSAGLSGEAAPAPATLTWSSPSTLLLIIANLVPIAGLFLWDWDLANVMVLYWAESAVIGLFNLLKMAVIGKWTALLAGPFFLGHFGGFMVVHFLFIYSLFIKGPDSMSADNSLTEVAALFVALWPALLMLVLSHGYSFFANFMGRGEYRSKSIKNQMSEPYSRIIFMHLVLIFGGGLTLILGSPMPVLVAVILLKIVFDVRAHLKEHAG